MQKQWEFILQFSSPRPQKQTIFITTNLGYGILNEVKCGAKTGRNADDEIVRAR
jgi:hypothetical protein